MIEHYCCGGTGPGIVSVETYSLDTAHLHKIDGLVQERQNSIADALELRLSSINPSKYAHCFNMRCYVMVIIASKRSRYCDISRTIGRCQLP